MLIVGLTGGIATGKSTVAAMFAKLGAPVIDSDKIAREVVEPGTRGLQKVVEVFGPGVLTQKGHLNRGAMAKIVFNDEKARDKLNQIIHPLVKEEILKRLAKLKSDMHPAVIVDVPLLFEAGFDQFMDVTVVVYCPEEIQIRRLIKRDGLSRPEAQARIAAQMSIEEKATRADYLIDNSRGLQATRDQVRQLWERWKNENCLNCP